MSLYVDIAYAKRLGARLPNFKQISQNVFKFSHTCEEERFGKVKTRAYIIQSREDKTLLHVYCHHCGLSQYFRNFLKSADDALYTEYRMEKFKDSFSSTNSPEKQEEPQKESKQDDYVVDQNIIFCDTLPQNHPVLQYVKNRKIPPEYYSRLGFVSDFNRFAGKYNPVFEKIKTKYPRLIIPFYNEEDTVIGYSCRSFGKETPKYIKLQLDEDIPLIYGLWKVDLSKDIFVTEGQFDSLCLDNAIAVGGADYSSSFVLDNKEKIIIVPDSDYKRNANVYRQLEKMVESGFRIALLPETIPYKDINDCVVHGGFTSDQLTKILGENVFCGPAAKLEMIFRRK